MFDVTRFSTSSDKGKSNLTSVVSDYELVESVQPTDTEVGLVYADLIITFVVLCPITSTPLLLISWYVWPIPYGVIVSVSLVINAMVSLSRYERNLIWLKGREKVATGKVDWEKHEVSQTVQAGKTKVVYVDYQALSNNEPQPHEIHFGLPPEFSFPPELLQAVFTLSVAHDYKFNKQLMKQVDGITDNNYGALVTELMQAGWLRLKGKTKNQGVELTKKGKRIVTSRLLPSPTSQ